MKLEVFKSVCKKCNNVFYTYHLRGNPYGEFLMKTRKAESAYLNTFDDKLFDQLNFFVKKDFKFSSFDIWKKSKIFHSLFSVTCDLSPSGYEYQINPEIICPKCGSNEMSFWGPTNPLEFVEKDVPVIAHNAWNKLSKKEQQARIDAKIDEILKDPKKFGIE